MSKALQARQSSCHPFHLNSFRKAYISVAKAPTKIVLKKIAFRFTIVLFLLLVGLQWLLARRGSGVRVDAGEDACHG